jgi:hypothetical protein
MLAEYGYRPRIHEVDPMRVRATRTRPAAMPAASTALASGLGGKDAMMVEYGYWPRIASVDPCAYPCSTRRHKAWRWRRRRYGGHRFFFNVFHTLLFLGCGMGAPVWKQHPK